MSRIWQKYLTVALAVFTGVSLMLTGCGQSKAPTTKQKKTAAGPVADQIAGQRGYILVGFPEPLSGPEAQNGEPAKWTAQQFENAVNNSGGIYIKSLGKKLPVKVQLVDTQSSSTVAAQVSTELLQKDHADILMVEATPDNVSPVCGIGERYGVPVLGVDSQVEPWLSGGPYHWSFLAGFSVAKPVMEFEKLIGEYAGQTDKVIGLVMPNSPDGVGAAAGWNAQQKALSAKGYALVDPGRFPYSTNDFTSLISTFKSKHVELVTGAIPPGLLATFWRQAHEQGYVPKIAMFGPFDCSSDPPAIGGSLANGICTTFTWSPDFPYKDSFTGQTGQALAAAYEKATGHLWGSQLGADVAGFEVIKDVLTRAASVDPKTLLQALVQTDVHTMIGPVKFEANHVSSEPEMTGQWVYQGAGKPWKLVSIIGDPAFPEIPAANKLAIFPIPK